MPVRLTPALWCGLCLGALLLASAAGASYLHHLMHKPLPGARGQTLEVARGQTLDGLARQLHQGGLLQHPLALRIYARLTRSTRIKAGRYRLPDGTSAASLLQAVHRGLVVQYSITLVNGWRHSDVLAALQGLELTGDADDPRGFVEDFLGAPDGNPEGLLYADTYFYNAGDSRRSILRRAHLRLLQVLDEEWQGRAEGLPLDHPYEALILASIVEKETAMASERARIAGVFTQRLRLGMRLQTDPTIIYGLGADFDGDLRRRHLKRPGPYNSYINHGLPPTPIALVGRQALHATLHPDEGPELYFVARGDGSHHFSATLEEHRRAVHKYQVAGRAKDYRSTPERMP